MLDVRADVLKIAAYDPQDERQTDQLIDPDQADIGIGEAQRLEIQTQGQKHEKRRSKAEGQQRKSDIFTQTEFEAGEGIGGGHAEQQ